MAELQLLEFQGEVVGRRAAFEEEDGWRADDAKVPLQKALEAAELESMTFHELRHSYASDLVNRGVPLVVVAHQLGHADTQMVEKHYGHLCKTAEQRMIREGGKTIGLLEPEPEPKILALQIQTPRVGKGFIPESKVTDPFEPNPVRRREMVPDHQVEIPLEGSLLPKRKKAVLAPKVVIS
jgi:hypothetical protein